MKILNAPLIKFLKGSAKNLKNIKFNRKRYLFDKAFSRKEFIPYVPDVFNIAITFRCTLRCPSCQYLLKDGRAFDKAQEMPTEDFKWILENFKKDIRTVVVQGGEPLLHPQFPEIVHLIKEKKLNLRMSTNGTLIKDRINEFKNLNIVTNISLDGIDYPTFKKLRNGTEKQYQDIIEGMSLLRKFQIPFQVSFLLFEETLPQVNKILDFVREIRPSLVRFQAGNPHGSAAWTPLTAKSHLVQNFIKEVLNRSDYPFSIKMPVIFDQDSELFQRQNCFQPWAQAYVGWNGDIAYCCQLAYDRKIGNMFDGYDFNSPMMVKFRKEMIANNFPADCLYCPVRFWEKLYCDFNCKEKRWIISPDYQKIISKER